MAKSERRLSGVTYVVGASGTQHVFQAGTTESEINEAEEGLAEKIDNKSAWATPLSQDEADELGLEGVPGSYEEMTVPQLVDLVKERSLDVESNRKADLVKALEDSDGASDQ